MTLPSRKTLAYFALSLALVAGAVFWVGMDTSWAQTKPPAAAGIGNALGSGALNGAVNGLSAIAFIAGVLLVIYGASTLFLTIVGNFLDNVFSWNLLWNPSTIPVVLDGWRIMRDLANGFFILVVLWIAITIIFNLDSLGGKKLLVRVIVVALLINFSLLMVSAVFAFANVLARPFYTAIGLDLNNKESSISKVITAKTFIQETAKTVASTNVQDLFKNEVSQQTRTTPNEGTSAYASLWRSLGGVRETQAAGPLALAWIGLKWFGPTIAVALAQIVASMVVAGGTIAIFWSQGMSLIVADVFLLALLMAYVTMTVLLLLRLAAMIFLAILAPIAFISLVIPRYGERFWNQWLSYLFNWAFMAPVFYFMLYIALLFQDQMFTAVPGGSTGSNMGFGGNVYKMLALTMFLAILWTAIITARKMGGAIAETALTFGKKLAGVGLGLGTGLVARKALPWAGRLATGLQEKINQGSPLVRSTLGRGLTAYGLGRMTRASRQQVLDAQARINSAGWTSAEIQQRLASGYFKNKVDVAAAVGVLRSRGDLDPQAGVQGYGDEHLRAAAETFRGLKTDIVPLMRANPTIAEQTDFSPAEFDAANPKSALNEVLGDAGRSGTVPTSDDFKNATELLAWRRLRPQDVDTFDLNLLKNDDNKRRFLQIATGNHLSRLGGRDTRVAADIQQYLDNPANEALWNSFSHEKQRYFTSSAAQAIGVWHVPPYSIAKGGIKDDKAFRILQPVVAADIAKDNPAYAGPTLAAGGTAPYMVTLVRGALPNGLHINAAGQIEGNTMGLAEGAKFVADYDIRDSGGAPPERVSIHIIIRK